MRRLLWATTALFLLVPQTMAREGPSDTPPAGRGRGDGARMVLGPVTLQSWPEDRRRRPTACLEVWLGHRRMARSCREASLGRVFFHRIRLASRRPLPVTLRVQVEAATRWGDTDPVRPAEGSPGQDAVLAQALPDLVTSYGPEEPGSGKPRERPRPARNRGGSGGPKTCVVPVAWPGGPGEVTASCGGWEFLVRRGPWIED